MSYLFTSESVSEGHPDKVADQISDALLDEFLRRDPKSKVACETLVTTGLVVLSGEIRTEGYVDVQHVARDVVNRLGYSKAEYMFDGGSCGVLSAIEEQSPDIFRGVARETPVEQGAGDQGMMFGYATRETHDYMPLPIELAHITMMELSKIRKEGRFMQYLRPDAKSQFTLEYEDRGVAQRVHTIVVSTQHAPEIEDMSVIKQDMIDHVIAPVMGEVNIAWDNADIYVNPTGRFVVGGPMGDTGLTGRKIIVDTYGGMGRHGGGAFSGKDCTKVDRSAAYAARWVAKNVVAAGLAKKCEVQLAYAIGVSHPLSIMVDTFGTGIVDDAVIEQAIEKVFDLRPGAIIRDLKLRRPIFSKTAAYGHFGRKDPDFTWEATDRVQELKDAVSALQA